MLRHAIAPTRRFTKASHDVVRHQRLNSDAKVLLLYVQGLPGADASARSLSEHALRLGLKGRAYQRAKQLLAENGYLWEWRSQGERGRWVTEQLLANVTLTGEEAGRARGGRDEAAPPGERLPSERPPAVGGPSGRHAGGSYPEEEQEKNLPHPPPEEAGEPAESDESDEPDEPADVEVAEAERVLLSLRQESRDLLLGVREVRALADVAAEWLRRGVSAGELRRALTVGLPVGGVRSAVGFVRHRLVQKLPGEGPAAVPGLAVGALVTCEGPGEEHVFRRVGEERVCGRCRVGRAAEASASAAAGRGISWRERVAGVAVG
ncbi:hypothetical protein ACQB60_11810 [Actinomycetota bacterium Odt1-20B]